MGFWFKNWVDTGGMDQILQEHQTNTMTPVVVRTIGDVYYHIFRKPDVAIRYYQWFIRDYAPDKRAPEVHWDLGRAYEQLNKKDLALEQYTVLISSYSETQQGRMALERYNRIKF